MFSPDSSQRRFRAEQEDARYAVGLRVFADLFVQRKDMQQVKVLTLILVQTFDLDIEDRLRVDLNPGTLLHKLSQMNFVGLLDIAISLTERRIVSIFFRADQLVEVIGPLFFSVSSSSEASAGLHCLIQRRGVMPLVTLWNLFGHSWLYSGNRSLPPDPSAAPPRR